MQIKTVVTTAAEQQIKFNRRYQYIWLKNLGEDYVYVSDKPGIVASADNVAKLSAGEILMLTSINDDIYTLGATTLECHAQEYSSCPFGEVGGSGGGSEAVLGPKSVTQNGDYYAVDDEFDGYSSVSVNVEANVDSKSITQNGTYSAATDNLDGYSSVSVDVPNSYSVSDEGKVVSSGALVSQTSTTKTQNGTYDTTLNDEVVVDVTPTLERVLLYGAEDYSEPTVVGTTYNWADNLSNYDSIGIVSSNPTDLADGIIFNHFFDVPTILRAGIQPLVCQYYQRLIGFTATDTTFTIIASSSGQESATYAPAIYKIYGYKGG